MDGGKLTTEFGGTRGSSIGPGLLLGEEFVLVGLLFADRLNGEVRVLLVSSAHELSLVVAFALAEVAETTGLSLEGTAISVVAHGHVSAPSSLEELV